MNRFEDTFNTQVMASPTDSGQEEKRGKSKENQARMHPGTEVEKVSQSFPESIIKLNNVTHEEH